MPSDVRPHILLWGIHEDKVLEDAIRHLKKHENPASITLAIQSHRVPVFKNAVDRILEIKGDVNARNLRLLGQILRTRTEITVIPCRDDHNLYYAVSPILNRTFFFKKRAAIGLLKHGILTKIPVESQTWRPWALWPVALGVLSALAGETALNVFWLVSGITAALWLADKCFEAFLKNFKRAYYLSLLMFRREEFPYVSHGWMHPYHEKYLNRLVFSREGPAQNLYDIGEDFFPIYRPTAGRQSVADHFQFVNTHAKKLDRTDRAVFVVGGSVAQGLFSEEISYHAALEKKLKSDGHALDVIPWAIGGYQSTQERVLVELSLIERKPFAVLSLDFYNDALFTLMGIPPGDTQRSQKKYLSGISTGYKILSCFFGVSVFARYVWQKEYDARMTRHLENLLGSPEKLDVAAAHCVSVYLENIHRIHRLCANEGIRHLAFVQPFRDARPVKNSGEPGATKASLMQIFYKKLLEIVKSSSEKWTFLILEPSFDKEDFCDEVHLTESGQKKLADHLYREMAAKILTVREIQETPAPVEIA